MEVAYDGLEHRLRRLLAVMSPNRSTSHCTNLSGFTEREESVPKLDCRSEMASLLGITDNHASRSRYTTWTL